MIYFLKSLFTRTSKPSKNPGHLSILTRIFNEEYYLKKNTDVAEGGMDALDHYLKYGFKERRLPCDDSDIAAAVNQASENEEYAQSVTRYLNIVDTLSSDEKNNRASINTLKFRKLILPFHSKGNFFFKEISQHIAEAAIEAGIDAEVVNEKQFKKLEGKGCHYFFVAPQEFFYLGRKEGLHQYAKSLMPNVTYLLAEQPQTVFFLSQLEYIFDDVHVVDMNFHVAAYLRSFGIDCHYLPLGSVESLRQTKNLIFGDSCQGMHLPKASYIEDREQTLSIEQRPLDAVFIGNGCERRQQFFSQYAEQFSKFDMAIFMPNWKVPHEVGGLATLDANDSVVLCQKSKIFLNVHRDNFKYFEWHRICMRGFLSGALVLTEPVFAVPEFESGVHYLECSLDDIPEKINWLINTSEGATELSRIAQAGREAYLETSMKKSISSYLEFIDSGEVM